MFLLFSSQVVSVPTGRLQCRSNCRLISQAICMPTACSHEPNDDVESRMAALICTFAEPHCCGALLCCTNLQWNYVSWWTHTKVNGRLFLHGMCGKSTFSVLGAVSSDVKRPAREADNSPPSSAEVKECVTLCRHPQYVFMAWCLLKSTGKTSPLPKKTSV
jgi:hypothetical protein